MKKTNFKPTGSKKTLPITREQFEYILEEFHDRGDLRMEIIAHLMYRCVRIGDILKTLTIGNVYPRSGRLRSKIEYQEEKTGKLRTIAVRGEQFTAALRQYSNQVKKYSREAPLFYSEKTGKPLRDSGVKFLLRSFIGKRGIRQCSPHSFRKGGARYMYDNGVRIEAISNVLNHHTTRTTEIYIDITPKDIEESMRCLEI